MSMDEALPEKVKVVVTVPLSHADRVRRVIGDAGGGMLGAYTHCSCTTTGTGRFRPGGTATPAIGTPGADETVEEERIEVTVSQDRLLDVLAAIRTTHPYEEPVIDVYPLLSLGGHANA